jgi:fucose 4-O-acetylase-like acetyltransferase
VLTKYLCNLNDYFIALCNYCWSPTILNRRLDIDLAKGVAIALVVFGHLVARQDPQGVDWYEPLRRVVYAFHMPFLLYLSGLTASLSGLLARPAAFWLAVAARRGRRLLLPFLVVGLIILIAKLSLGHVMPVDNRPAGFWPGVDGLLLHTGDSPALSLWYLPVLFTVSLGCMMLCGARKSRYRLMFVVALILYAAPVPAIMYLDRTAHYAVFFVVGAWAGLRLRRWEQLLDRYWAPAMALFLACLVAIGVYGRTWPTDATLLITGLVSLPALHGWLRNFSVPSPALLLLGRYSFMVYLFNTMFIGLAKGLLSLLWSWDGAAFLPFAAAMLAAGLAGPLTLKRLVLRRVPVLDRLTD